MKKEKKALQQYTFNGLLFLLTFVSQIMPVRSQPNSTLIIHKPSCDSIEYVLKANGKRCLTLEPGEHILVDQHPEDRRSTLFQYVKLYDAQEGPLVIKSEGKAYFLDTLGKRTLIPAAYEDVRSAWGGLYKARLAKQSRCDTSFYTFLNAQGEAIFGDQRFLFATSFNGGQAIVQTLDGAWRVITKDQKMYPIELEKDTDLMIKSARSFYNGLALIKAKWRSSTSRYGSTDFYYYIDSQGQTVIDVARQVSADVSYSPTNFDAGHAFVLTQDSLHLFDTLGNIRYTVPDVTNIMNWRGRFMQCYLRDNSRIIIDRDAAQQLNFFASDPAEHIIPDQVMGDHLKLYYTNTTSGQSGYRYVNLQTQNVDFTTNHQAITVVNGKLLVGSERFPNDLYFMLNKDGTLAFKNDCK
ncbi:MAG: hypothetical protein AAGJ93_03215 [Bacteroidota bacterium]